MARQDAEFPVREEYPLAPEEFPQPRPETEYRVPDGAAEYPPPPGTDYANPAEEAEFSPPGSGKEGSSAPPGNKRRLKRLLYAAASFVMLVLMFADRGALPEVPTVLTPPKDAPVYTPGSDISVPGATPAPSGEPTPAPQAVPSPVPSADPEPTKEPEPAKEPEPSPEPAIETDFFYFSHEHHARVRLRNTDAVRSVSVSVRETTLDKNVYEHEFSEKEIKEGSFELPMLSTGDIYMENMDAFDSVGGWPEFEMSVTARYDGGPGKGEESITVTKAADFEMGIGLNYMRSDYTWSGVIPPDSFYIAPWEETEDIRFVINDPDAVTDPLTFSVDLSCNGRHAAQEEYEVVVETNEYDLVDSETGERTPHIGRTKELLLRRPDWMPEEGVLHVRIVQLLASTGEKWVREFDYEYPQHYDWED